MCNLTDLYRLNLPHRAISVYLYLSARANKDGVCWPAISTITRDLKISESTVHRAINDLRKAELIRTEQRYRENGGNSSLKFMLQKGDCLGRLSCSGKQNEKFIDKNERYLDSR